MPPAASPLLQCCCGRDQCAYLEYSSAALECLEKDVRTAAQIGQVCLPSQQLALNPVVDDNAIHLPFVSDIALLRLTFDVLGCR